MSQNELPNVDRAEFVKLCSEAKSIVVEVLESESIQEKLCLLANVDGLVVACKLSAETVDGALIAMGLIGDLNDEEDKYVSGPVGQGAYDPKDESLNFIGIRD